jgi:hypothetical protein
MIAPGPYDTMTESVRSMLGDKYDDKESVFFNLGVLEVVLQRLRVKVKALEESGCDLP